MRVAIVFKKSGVIGDLLRVALLLRVEPVVAVRADSVTERRASLTSVGSGANSNIYASRLAV